MHRATFCFNTQPPEGGWRQTATAAALQTLFQHTAARRRLAERRSHSPNQPSFNTQPPEGGWIDKSYLHTIYSKFQHTAARRRLAEFGLPVPELIEVSTHSRPKAAGNPWRTLSFRNRCFNTQPPEGGWGFPAALCSFRHSFNTQPPEGGWAWR